MPNSLSEVILVLAPHTDDGELGCGATIAKHIERGNIVHYVAFSTCEQSVPSGFPSDILRYELLLATKELGIEKENVHIYNYEVRKFSYFRQEILEDMILLRNRIKPTVVYIPSVNDNHQDHYIVANEARRAFKNSNLFSYELPWNNYLFGANYYEVVTIENVKTKIKSVSMYSSQQKRSYTTPEYLKSLAVTRGVVIGHEFAESFEVVRIIKC